MRLILIGLLVTSTIALAQTNEQLTVIHAGTLLAIPGEAAVDNQTVVLQGNRIVRIENGFVDPSEVGENATLIDLSDKFVLPGLMDMHVHLLFELGPNSRADALTVTTSMSALRGAQYARRTLHAGFTTVRDLGGDPEAIYALRGEGELILQEVQGQGLTPQPVAVHDKEVFIYHRCSRNCRCMVGDNITGCSEREWAVTWRIPAA